MAAGWVAKRFWAEVTVEAVAGGFGVRLDARAVKTPAKAEFVVPSRALAEAVACEWRAQQAVVDPQAMPFTGAGFLLSFSLSNVHFHATTAYDIFRMKGVPLGKKDYLGNIRMKT